jgi:hypothetical protein
VINAASPKPTNPITKLSVLLPLGFPPVAGSAAGNGVGVTTNVVGGPGLAVNVSDGGVGLEGRVRWLGEGVKVHSTQGVSVGGLVGVGTGLGVGVTTNVVGGPALAVNVSDGGVGLEGRVRWLGEGVKVHSTQGVSVGGLVGVGTGLGVGVAAISGRTNIGPLT